jgi:hypothetical protein
VWYPFHYPLTNCLVYLLAQRSDINPQFLNLLYYASLSAVFFSRILPRLGRRDALFLTLALASTPILYGFLDNSSPGLAFYVYFALAIIYLCEFTEGGRLGMLVTGAFFLSLLTWVRPAAEPTVLACIVVVGGWSAARRRWWVSPLVLGLAAAAYLPWVLYAQRLHVPRPMAMECIFPLGGGCGMRWAGLWEILRNTAIFEFANPRRTAVSGYAFAFAAAWGLASRRGGRALLWFLLGAYGAYVFIYYIYGICEGFGPAWRYALTGSSGIRNLAPLVPLTVYYISFLKGEADAR